MGRLLATIALACAVLAAGATSAPAYPGCPAAKGPDLALRAADKTRIVAHRWGTGRTAVVLVHQSGADLCQWAPYATRLAGLGSRAFALDLRGNGRSQYRPLPAGLRFTADIAAVVKEARREGATRVFVVGASLGANAAVVAAANIRPLIDGVVSLSAPGTFRLDAVGAARHLQVPAMYVASEVDEGGIYATDAKTMFDATPVTDKAVAIVPGGRHGVALVAGPGRVRSLVEGFLRTHSAG
jgi:pimeloyl-ACP methyl ester carboxylesterase